MVLLFSKLLQSAIYVHPSAAAKLALIQSSLLKYGVTLNVDCNLALGLLYKLIVAQIWERCIESL